MDTEKWFNDKLSALKDDADFRLETIILDLTEQISERLKEKGMTRAKLAEDLGVTPAAVTKLLNGNPNFTLKTLLKVADALKLEFNVSFGAQKKFSKLALVFPFPAVPQIQISGISTDDDMYPKKEPPKVPFNWNSDDSTTDPRYGGSSSY
jgi:transcriptional regulator with XRE-family HTH domain